MTVIECSQLTALRSRRCVALFRMSGKSMPVLSSIGGGFFSSSDGKITPIALPYTRLQVNLEEWTRGIDTRAESESAATAIHHPSSLQQSKGWTADRHQLDAHLSVSKMALSAWSVFSEL